MGVSFKKDMSAAQRLEEAELFLMELGRGIPETERVIVGYADEATVQKDKDGRRLNSGWWPQPYKPGKYINTNANCYACISSSIKTPNPKTGQMRYWRGESSFGHGLALMVDDIGDGTGSKGGFSLESIKKILMPTAILETSPHNYQCWYFLDEPAASMDYFKAFLNSFVDNVLSERGGDRTIRDVARYGRMPCGFNNKRLEDGRLKYGENYRVHLLEADYGRRYSMREIARSFGFSIVIPQRREIDHSLEYNQDNMMVNFYCLKVAERLFTAAKMGEGPGGEARENMSGNYRVKCPWGGEHTNGDPWGAYFRGPNEKTEKPFVFHCSHDTCRNANRTWAVFIREIIWPKIISDLEETNLYYSK